MERTQKKEMNRSVKRRAGRGLAFLLAIVMVFQVTVTPVDAFSLGGFFKKVSNTISNTVKSIQKIVDTSSSKTVYSYSELNSFLGSLFAPKNITVKLGADIYVPSNRTIASALHNVDMDMNGHTIYSDNTGEAVLISYGRTFNIRGGTIVQRVNTSNGVIDMTGGDATIKNVTIKKSGSASRVTGLDISGILADPKITFENVTFDGMTTGLNIEYGGVVVMNNSCIKNSQGDAVNIWGRHSYNQKDSKLTMTDGSIKYFKGNGINAGSDAKVTLTNVTVTGGTTRNRYGILAGKDAKEVNLKGITKVYSSAGGNIGVYKGHPVTIESLSAANKYSFTVVDGLNGTEPSVVAKLTRAYSGDIRSLPAYSDISRYMVRGNEDNTKIQIQNPPPQCNVTAELYWDDTRGVKEEDTAYATLSVNGGAEETSGSVIVKYDAKVTLSTTNNNPARYKFLGWYKYVAGSEKVLVSSQPTCQVEVFDENVTYKAEYQYMKYTITVVGRGKGSVTGGGTYYVDDTAILIATPNESETVGDKTTTYGFNKWNDGVTATTRTITVTKDETYIGMFKKTGQTTGTLYLGLKEVTGNTVPSGNLLLVYVGKGFEDNRMETGATGTNVAVTGLPEGSAKMRLANSNEISGAPSNSAKSAYTFVEGKANYYGYKYGPVNDPTTSNTTCVHWDEKAADFDDCNPGFIRKETINGQDCWLYWCNAGGVQAAGPYVLYQYTDEITFSMASVKIVMNSEFKPTTAEDTVSSSAIIAVATASDGKQYTLGGLKFGDESKGLDNKINYREGDKTIALELDGITCDYDFPEATINGTQYTKLSDAIAAATASGNGETIKIVGPGVDQIDVTTPVNLAQGDKIEGYDSETVTATQESQIGVDKDGTVRLTQGTLEVDPPTDGKASVGVKDAFATTDKKIQVTTTDGGKNSVITPEEAGTTLQISPDNNPEHLVTINEAGGNGKTYEFDNIPSYAGETVQISKETEYTINLPGGNTASGSAIKTGKYNTGETTVKGGTDDGNPVITSTKEGDKVTVGGNTYVTGKNENDEPTTYRVNPDQTKEPSVVLEQGSLGIPKDTTIKVKDTIIKNTGATNGGAVTGANPVQINASGEIEIPDGAGVTIDGVEIQVPAKTPMNGNTTVTLDDDGKPTIKTTGDSEVKLVDKNGKETTYQVGDYDAVLTIGDDGIPVIEDGEVRLQPGQTIKDRLGNEYRCPEDATEGITIMTTPLVYETDDNGNQIIGEDGKPILVGGGDMSFVLPEDTGIECKPKGSLGYQTFINPGDGEGFFNLDPERAADGIQADSELGLAAGKKLNLNIGDKSIAVEAPASGNSGAIRVDGSTGSVTLTKAGDTVIIDGKTYTAKADNTVFIIDEDGVTLAAGSGAAEQGKALNAESLAITGGSGSGSMSVSKGTDSEGAESTAIHTSGKTEFAVAPIGNEDTKVTFVTDEGEHSYPVGIDGSISLPQGEAITRKSGTSQVAIQAPGNADITMKPLAKPSKAEIADGVSTPVGGLLIEVPTGSAVTIGGKTYQETTIDNGREGEEAYSLPMQLVLDEKGKVVLYSGTAELNAETEISLYDVNNTLATFKNTSPGGQKVQVTNPGIATMPNSGTSITMGDGKKPVEFTTTMDNTQIAYTPDLCLLKRGGVNLNPQEKILVNDMVVQNTSTGTGNKDVEVILNETLTDGEFVTTGKIEVPNGGSFTLSSPGSDKEISYQSNVQGSGYASFTINEDGNLVLPEGGIATLKDEKGTETKVQAGVADVESIPTPDGAMFAIPAGGSIVVGDVTYTNAKTGSGEDSYLVLEVNQDGKVVLVKGDVELSEGAIVYVKSEEETLVPIKNTAQTASGEVEGTKILVKYEGTTDVKDANDKVVSTTYPEVDIQVPNGGSISIGENKYNDVSPTTGENVQISMDIAKNSDSEITDGEIDGDRIVLKSGTVDLGADSSIQILVPENDPSATPKVVTNIGNQGDKAIPVGSDGKIELPEGSAASVEDGNDITTISIPADSEDAYKAAVDIGSSDGTVKVQLQNENGGVSGAGKKVIINDDTYVSKETGKNLSLTLDTVNDQVKLSDTSTSVGLSGGASIVVDDTTVTATTETEITVTQNTNVTPKVPEVAIPSGGEANFKNPTTNQDIDVKVPEKTAEEGSDANEQKFTVGADGSISTALKKDETVVIGGVEYTGTSEDNDDNTIKVNGKTGALIGSPAAAPKTAIDSELFNKTDYVYELPAGASVLVDGVEYQAGTDSAITLYGNPDGKPIVKLGNAASVVIGKKTYTAAAADTRFVLGAGNQITLIDNGQEGTANSSLTIQGKDKVNIAGVTFSGKTDDDSYTVTYHADGSYVSVMDGTKLLVDMPTNSKIYVTGQGAVETKDETGAAVTRTFTGPIPVTMKGGSGSVYLDKTREELTNTAFVQIVGLKDVEILYNTVSEGAPTVMGIVVRPKQIIPVPDFGGESEKPSTGGQQNVVNIPVTGDTGEQAVTLPVPVVVEENKIIVDTITTEMVEQLINTETEGTKVVAIDCTSLEKPIVVLDTVTVENMTEKADQIKIITAIAEIEIDKQATEAILEQATGDRIEIKVNSEHTDILNEAQKETLQNYQVQTCLDAFVESNGIRIHDFKGGKVKVSIPWNVEKGKKAVYYHVYYLDTDGAMDIYDTVYEGGKLWFETEHFSEYVIVYDDELLNATPVDQSPLLASVTKVGKTSLRLKWNHVEGADRYIIYAAKCNTAHKSYKLKKVATVSSTKNTYVLKKLKAGTKYKIVVKAVGDGTKLKQSMTLHVVTKGGKYTNTEKLTVSPAQLVLKAGKTRKQKVSYRTDRYAVNHERIVRYASSNSEIAAVTAKGKIKAKRTGTCKVYALLCSGEYVVITVTVK